ncbi:MAG: hypothetical protein LAO76_01535 [Acidobacteriia bacterium]|nr:hypothetical protein [Terriglobia bacterium]
MLRDLLRFLWTAFIDHWATWVTGTGVVGLFLWAANYYERIKGTPMKLRTNILILFCTFWFFATFAAWHDADHNLDVAKTKDAQDTREWDVCKGDLKAEIGRAELLDGQLHSAQNNFSSQLRTLSGQQQTMDSQQVAMNSCVVALGKANTPEPAKTTFLMFRADRNLPQQPGKHINTVVLMSNRTISPVRGIFACEGEIKEIDPVISAGPSGIQMGTGGPIQQGHMSEVSISSPAWTPMNPLVITVFYDEDDLGRCAYRPL